MSLRLILASQSPYKRQLLSRLAGDTHPSGIDESALPGSARAGGAASRLSSDFETHPSGIDESALDPGGRRQAAREQAARLAEAESGSARDGRPSSAGATSLWNRRLD